MAKEMWAGVVDGKIMYSELTDSDPYLPVGVALFTNRSEAKKRFEHVVLVDVDKLLKEPRLLKPKEHETFNRALRSSVKVRAKGKRRKPA